MSDHPDGAREPWTGLLARRDVLAGLMFVAIAAFGLWLSRDYTMGTTLRMGTGYVPRLLCWLLLMLGAIVFVGGLRGANATRLSGAGLLATLRPIVVVALSLVAFGLALERLGLVVSILLLIGIASFAASGLRVIETLVAAAVLIVLCWAIFIAGLGLTIPVWPEW